MPEAKVTIRECRAADMVRVSEIYARSVREETASFELEPPDLAEMSRRRDALLDAGYPYLVAEIDGQVAGYAHVGAYKLRPAYGLSVESTVYVDPAFQRDGVGRALMEALIKASRERGYRQMIAIIGDSSYLASIEFHKQLGFVFAGNLKSVGYKHGKWLDSVLLQLPLAPGDTTPPDKIPGE